LEAVKKRQREKEPLKTTRPMDDESKAYAIAEKLKMGKP
jgi:hypothetical protein